MATKTTQLDYAPGLPPWRKRRLVRRGIALCMVLICLFLFWWLLSPDDWVRLQYWQYRCENHLPKQKLPVFSSDPTVVAKICFEEFAINHDRNDDAFSWPDDWLHLCRFRKTNAPFTSGVVFLHERRIPSGEKRLVSTQIGKSSYRRWIPAFVGPTSTGDAVPAGQKVELIWLLADVFKPSWGYHITSCKFSNAMIVLPWKERFSIYDGVADPVDPSRFTMRYDLKGQNGTIEGRLRADDSVLLQVLDGPLVLYEPPASLSLPTVARPSARQAATRAGN